MFMKMWKKTVLIIGGCVLYATGIGLFLEPFNLTPAGITGVAMIISHFTDLPVGTASLIINAPIMALGIYKFGGKFFVSTVFATVISSLLINLAGEYFTAPPIYPIFASLLGGAFMSLGMAFIFKAGATTGGTDIIVRILVNRYRNIKTGYIYWITDSLVVLMTTLVFGNASVLLYAAVTLSVQTVILNATHQWIYNTETT